MKRKVIQIAESTQLISLPRKWCLQYGIKKGDELDVEPQSDKLVIRTSRVPEISEIEIDVSNLDRSSILHTLRNVYRRGVNTIKVNFSKQVTTHYRTGDSKKIISVIHEEANRLPGLEIIQQRENFCLLKGVSDINEKEFDNVLRRSFILLTDMSKDLLMGVKNNDRVLVETIEEKHFSVTKFINLCLRMLNQKNHLEANKMTVIYHIISTLWLVSGSIKYCARDFLRYNKKISPDAYRFMELIDQQIQLYYEIFYRFNLDKARKMSENKETIKSELDTLLEKKINPHEVTMVSKLATCLESIVDITGARAALEF